MPHPLLVDDPFWNHHRFWSAVLACLYLLAALYAGDARGVLLMLLFIPIPLACIWFPDFFTDDLFTRTDKVEFGRRPWLTPWPPPGAVRLIGWLALMTPFVSLLLFAMLR